MVGGHAVWWVDTRCGGWGRGVVGGDAVRWVGTRCGGWGRGVVGRDVYLYPYPYLDPSPDPRPNANPSAVARGPSGAVTTHCSLFSTEYEPLTMC